MLEHLLADFGLLFPSASIAHQRDEDTRELEQHVYFGDLVAAGPGYPQPLHRAFLGLCVQPARDVHAGEGVQGLCLFLPEAQLLQHLTPLQRSIGGGVERLRLFVQLRLDVERECVGEPVVRRLAESAGIVDKPYRLVQLFCVHALDGRELQEDEGLALSVRSLVKQLAGKLVFLGGPLGIEHVRSQAGHLILGKTSELDLALQRQEDGSPVLRSLQRVVQLVEPLLDSCERQQQTSFDGMILQLLAQLEACLCGRHRLVPLIPLEVRVRERVLHQRLLPLVARGLEAGHAVLRYLERLVQLVQVGVRLHHHAQGQNL
mmetsp:Transcript_8465/g.25101  ORF Transcript_8465/g.25101 Transcript_8465/m.25101 type:complete len:318 (-) Transcript_8465:971-1924(-)